LPTSPPFVTGLVLAAGSSQRLGRPKQLLPFRGTTLLDATLAIARDCGFAQLLMTVGGGADAIHDTVDLAGVEVVQNPDYASGCSSSLRAALAHVDPRAQAVVLLLGDQPGVRAEDVATLTSVARDLPIGVCRYEDGLGHPFWFGRAMFAELSQLHGDKAIWKLLQSGRFEVTEATVVRPIPLDVDTGADYDALLGAETSEQARR
jgi:molybdenum cofactor cytidylyltransferase